VKELRGKLVLVSNTDFEREYYRILGYEAEEIEKIIEFKRRWRKAVNILRRLKNYAQGYLEDYRIEAKENFTSNPLTVTIKVYIDIGEEGEKEERSN